VAEAVLDQDVGYLPAPLYVLDPSRYPFQHLLPELFIRIYCRGG
jgi:hypothetical protein